MPSTSSVPPALRQLANIQCGVVLLSQAIGLGLSRKTLDRHLASGQWTRVDRGLFLTRPDPFDWPTRVWAASLRGGPEAIVGARSALAWHGVTDPHSGAVVIYLPVNTRPEDRPFAEFRRSAAQRLTTTRKGLMTASVTDALIDAAQDLTPEELEAAIATAAQRGRLSQRRLDQPLISRRSASRRAVLQDASEDALNGSHSPLELSYLNDVERAHGLPTSERQHATTTGYRDAVYEEFTMVVELDWLNHLKKRFRDRRRDNRNARGNWLTLRYGSIDIAGDPCAVAREVAENLITRGWSSYPTSCGRC